MARQIWEAAGSRRGGIEERQKAQGGLCYFGRRDESQQLDDWGQGQGSVGWQADSSRRLSQSEAKHFDWLLMLGRSRRQMRIPCLKGNTMRLEMFALRLDLKLRGEHIPQPIMLQASE